MNKDARRLCSVEFLGRVAKLDGFELDPRYVQVYGDRDHLGVCWWTRDSKQESQSSRMNFEELQSFCVVESKPLDPKTVSRISSSLRNRSSSHQIHR